MIIRKTPEEIEAMAASGQIVARCLGDAQRPVPPGRHDRRARPCRGEVHPHARAASPPSRATAAFRRRSAPRRTRWWCTGSRASTSSSAATCISLDVGVEYEGWVADAAVTVALRPVSPVASKLLKATREALEAAVEQCRPGNRLGDVSHAVQERVERTGSR